MGKYHPGSGAREAHSSSARHRHQQASIAESPSVAANERICGFGGLPEGLRLYIFFDCISTFPVF